MVIGTNNISNNAILAIALTNISPYGYAWLLYYTRSHPLEV